MCDCELVSAQLKPLRYSKGNTASSHIFLAQNAAAQTLHHLRDDCLQASAELVPSSLRTVSSINYRAAHCAATQKMGRLLSRA